MIGIAEVALIGHAVLKIVRCKQKMPEKPARDRFVKPPCGG
jgi:hypothetical protein